MSEGEEQQEIPYVRSWTKVLSGPAATGTQTMAIPARLVNTFVSREQTEIIVHLEGGGTYKCMLKTSGRSETELYIAKGWYEFVKQNKMKARDTLHFWFGNDP